VVENLCVQNVLKTRYSFPRIQWLIGTISVISLIYLTSEEIWKLSDAQPFPEITLQGITYYTLFFLTALILVHFFDTRKIVEKKSTSIIASLISILIDLCSISLSELIVLCCIQVFPQDYLEGFVMLIVGAMPASLGSIVLTSLTSETLKERAKRLYEETIEISKQMEKLEAQRKVAIESLKNFERKRFEFEKYFEKKQTEDKHGEDENGKQESKE